MPSSHSPRPAMSLAPPTTPSGSSAPIPMTVSPFSEYNQAFKLPSTSPRNLPLPSPTGGGPLHDALAADGYPLFPRPSTGTATAPSPFFPPANFSTAQYRKPSLLASTAPLLPPAALSPPSAYSLTTDSALNEDDDDDAAAAVAAEEDCAMILGSPPPSLPGGTASFSTRQARSRSTSETNPTGNAASPVSLSRALHAGQRTPPPFLQRRLFNGMDDQDVPPLPMPQSSSRDDEDDMGLGLALDASGLVMDDTQCASGSGSGSGSGEEGRVVRRAVSRKPNLLPKPKSHLRVLSQLRTEESGPADTLEIASEATLHRLSRSSAAIVPPIKHAVSSSYAASHSGNNNNGGNGNGMASTSAPAVPRNRFPEQADEEDIGEASTSEEDDDGREMVEEGGSDWGGMSMGYGTEDEEERKAGMWTSIRTAGSSSGPIASGNGKSPQSERGRMEIEAPATPTWQVASRPGKRKMTDDRFEPYAQALKRRAVSPAASSTTHVSPTLSFHTSVVSTPSMPMPMSFNSATTSLPMTIPSPTLGASFFRQQPRSRAGSPAPGPSSLSSSVGREMVLAMGGGRDREDAGKEGRLGEAGDGLGKMSLG